MKKIFILSVLFFIIGKSGFTQIPSRLIGEWHVYEFKSDRLYKNFERDSIIMFNSYDQSAFTDKNVENNVNELLEIFSNSIITIGKNNIVTFTIFGEILEEFEFTYDNKLSTLSFNKKKSVETMKLKDGDLLVYDLTADSGSLILTFKKKKN